MISTTDENTNGQDFNNSQIDNLIFVDTNLANYQSLIPDTNNSNVVLIDSQENGIEQITAVLEQYSNLDSVSIFSHGDVGSIQLGDTYLSNNNLDSYQDDLAAWGNALSQTGDFLLYGCNVGADLSGIEFLDRVAHITGADVAASEDLTGNATLGGDWTLEVATGAIETPSFEVSEYGHLLDLNFNITYDTGTSRQQRVAFEMAAKMWSNVLDDNATINIHVSMASHSDLPANTLGGAVPAFVIGRDYSAVRQKLLSDRTTSDDNIAVQNLETGSAWDTIINGSGSPMKVSKVALTRANAKALNLIYPHHSALDGTIVMNDLNGTGLGWKTNYNTNSIESHRFDFTTVAMHEIGHILGFVSAVDAITPTTAGNSSAINKAATSLDLFRYVNNNERALRTGYANFSIDGGRTSLARMSRGTAESGNHIDDYQASHWRDEDNAGLMDPVAELSNRRNIGELDLKALDVIGWDRVAATKSIATLRQEALDIAHSKNNINRDVEVGAMLRDWRWARRGSRDQLRQAGNIAQYLAQEGFFSIGAFRESFDFSSVNPVTDNHSYMIVDNRSNVSEFQSNGDVNTALYSEPNSSDNYVSALVVDDGINYEQMVAKVTENLSNYEMSQLSLDDLAKLMEQQLVESVVPTLN